MLEIGGDIMRKISTTIQLSPNVKTVLDTLSKETGTSKSKLLEEAFIKYLDDLDVKIAQTRALKATSSDFIDHEEVKQMIGHGQD